MFAIEPERMQKFGGNRSVNDFRPRFAVRGQYQHGAGVLHSAAALRKRRKRSASRAAEFRKAYQYIRRRTKCMQYHEYKRIGLPIGSGVTEAACKTVVSQRLKLSGMRWFKDNAQVILNLRVVLLSGIWQLLYRKFLETHRAANLGTYGPLPEFTTRQAA